MPLVRPRFSAVLLAGLGLALGGCSLEDAAGEAPGGAGNGATAGTVSGGAGTTAGGAVGVSEGGAVSGGAGKGGSGGMGMGMSGSESGGMGGSAGGVGAAKVGVFVAQGHEGRITRSCDDGLTFPYNHSEDDTFRCFVDADHDCDHSAVAGRGLAFGADSFVATWGWGHPGKLQRSTDGKDFSDVMTETPTFADVAYGNGVFVTGGNPTRVSADGKTWEMGGKLTFDFNYRGIEFVPTAGGMFVVTGESGTQRAISTSRDGKLWAAATQRPEPCGQELRGVAGSPELMLVASGQGHVCYSTDGDVWTHVPVSDRFTSPPLWSGSEFWIYAGSKLFKSSDAKTWTNQNIEPANISIGPLARSPEGTLVAANDGWQVWYDKQRFFRSTDGVHWDTLPATAFTGSHPIYFISFGYLAPSAGCGAP